MKAAVFIPVRTKSTRLPNKALLEVMGRPIIEYLIERAKWAKLPSQIVLCTTTHPEDEVLVDIARKNGIDYFQGSEKDILVRYRDAADKYGIDFIVNADGDDIFCDHEYMDKVIGVFLKTNADYIRYEGLPLGITPLGIKAAALREVCRRKGENDTETGWQRYFTETDLFCTKIIKVRGGLRHPEIRMTLDYPEDLEFFREVIQRLYVPGRMFGLRQILSLLHDQPEIAEINKKRQPEYWATYRQKSCKITLQPQKAGMKFLIVGLGSMGKRRIRNLQCLQVGDIIGFDMRADRRREAEEKYAITTYSDFEKAMGTNPDALIISTPPDKHVEYALIAGDNNKHFFLEASVVLDGMEELINLCQGKDIVAAASCTMRFHPALKYIKQIVNSGQYGRVVNFSYHCGQYLPDWHPWEKVSDFYVSSRDTGACRELVTFELTWIVDVVGFPKRGVALYGKTRDVGADIDDTYVVALAFDGAFGNLTIDVTSRYATRRLILNLERGQILWRWDENLVRLYDVTGQKWLIHRLPRGQTVAGYNPNIIEDMYVEEIESFINAIKGKSSFVNSLEDDLRVLKLLYQMEGRL